MATHQEATRSLPEHPVLGEQLEHSASVECICCSEEWESGHHFVEEQLRALRGEQQALQEAEESELPVRYALHGIATSAARLLRDSSFQLITRCAECRVERARGESAEWMREHSP